MIFKNIDNLGKTHDFTIVGSGPASLTLALKLEDKGFTVLIIEAGDVFTSSESQEFYEGENIGDKYFELDVTRLRCFGGSSQHWGGWCRPLDRIDFEEWPIDKSNLDKYLTEASNILEIKDEFYKRKINNSIDQIGFNFSPPVRFKEKYFDRVKNSKKISLVLNTPLLKIIGNNNGLIKEVVVNNLGKNKMLSIKTLILGCGGIENSRILLWSKMAAKNNFLKDIYPGHYWMEHPHYEVATFVGKTSELKKIIDEKYSHDKYFFLSFNDKFLKQNKLKNISVRFQYQSSNEYKDQIIYDLACSGNYYSKKIAKLFRKNLACFYKIKMVWEQIPNINSNLQLSSYQKDIFGIPKVNLNWKKQEDDLNTPKVCLKEIGNFFMDRDIGRIGIFDFVINKTTYPEDDEIGGHHHMGGTRMGDGSNKYDVVDKNLKVFNTQNLFIAGSSVFRTGGHANPTLTITQLSLRLAEHLSSI